MGSIETISNKWYSNNMEVVIMFKKDNKDSSKKSIKKMNSISYDEHFTRTTESIDLAKNPKFVDIGDGTSKRKESEIEKFTR
jgi:hypothetical protein